MRKLLAIFRGSLHTIVYAVVILAVLFYLAVHFNLTGLIVKKSLTEQMSKQINSRITIDGDAEVNWLNQVVLNNVTIYDQQNDTLIHARRAMVAFDLIPLLSNHLVLNTCQLIDFDIRTYRVSPDSAANYQFLIDAFKQDDDPNEKPFIQRLDLNAILLRQGHLSYDVLDQPPLSDSPIDPNHISIDKLSANVHVHDTQLLIKKFRCYEHNSSIQADRCELSMNIREVMNAPEGENRFLLNIKGLELTNPQMTMKADASGSSDELELDLKQFDLPDGHPRLKGIYELFSSAKLRVTQLKNPIDSLYITADIRDLSLRVDTLGSVHMNGTIQGMPCHAQLAGNLSTDIGNAILEANLEATKQDTAQNSYKKRQIIVQGHCKTDGFELDRILPKESELGHAIFDLDYKMIHSPQQPLKLALIGQVGEIVWKEHSFKDVKINGEVQGKKIKGDIALNDSLGDVNSKFNIDFSQPDHHMRIDGTIAHFNPNGLKITNNKHLDSLTISAKIHADVIASNWHDAEGDMKISNLLLEKGDRQLGLDNIIFEGTFEKGELISSIANIKYDRNRLNHEYHIKGRIPVINDLFDILNIPIAMNREGLFEARIDSANHFMDAHAELPALDLQNGRALAATFDIEDDGNGVLLPTLDFEALTQKHRLVGTLRGRVIPDPLDITLEPTQLLYNKDELQLTGAHLMRTEEGDYVIENFRLSGGAQEIAASGTLGQSGDKSFVISLKHFDLDQVLGSFEKNYMHFGGRATGDIVINSEPELHIKTDSLYIHNFSYIDTLLGNAYLNAEVRVPQKFITISADIVTDSIYNSHAEFDFQMAKHDTMDLRVYPDNLPLGFINNWTGSILQQFSGRITGPVRLYGDMDHLQLVGNPYLDGTFTHDLIGAHFHIADTIHLDPNVIHVENGYVDDCHGHPLTLNARIDHEYLHNYIYDVNVDMPQANQGFLALDRPRAPGRIYWGQIYVQGQAQLKGGNGKHRVNINVGTTDKSWVYLSPYEQDIDTNQDAYTFLTFRDKKHLELMADAMAQEGTTLQIPVTQVISSEEEPTDLQVDLQVNGTEQCLVYFQMDPLSEDMLQGRGRGNLSIRYDPRRDITLAGTYRISQGSYTMNVKGDLMNKEFKLQNSSFVRFNGVPSEAELSLDCIYNIPSVNLIDLDENISRLGSLSRTTVPVDLNLSITGQLSAPIIRFDLEVKNVSDEIQAYVHNVIGTQEMLNQEVIYLLLFSKFYTPQYAQSTQSRTGSELTSFASASLTSQLNQLLSHVSNNFTMGTNFRTDKGDFSDMEMDVSLSTRLLGDRLLLNGNVGYRDPANRLGASNNTNSFIGDFDIEFLINNRGTIRAKAYSHYNERDYSINNALTTQGIGFILRRDFRNLYDLWPWNKWRKVTGSKNENNVPPKPKEDPIEESSKEDK